MIPGQGKPPRPAADGAPGSMTCGGNTFVRRRIPFKKRKKG